MAESMDRLSALRRKIAKIECLRPTTAINVAATGHAAIEAKLIVDYPFLDAEHARRLVAAYGTRVSRILGAARSLADLGQAFGATLTEAEVRHLMTEEWACSADDIVWRRSKLGLRMTPAEIAALDVWIGNIGVAPPISKALNVIGN